MADKRDLGLKVTDAIRLNEFAHILAAEFAARPSLAEDEFFAKFWTNDPNSFDWMRRANAKRFAEITVATAVREGHLEVWVRLADGEASVDHYSIPHFMARDTAAGAYVPPAHRDHALYGRPLWVKNSDWTEYREALMRARYPEEYLDAINPAPVGVAALSSAIETARKPSKPRLPDAKLQDWWQRLGPEGQEQTQADLLAVCRAGFPDHHISRQRIRDITGSRKRGKRPFRGKVTAK